MNEVIKTDLKIFVDNFIFIDKLLNKNFLITGATGLIGSTIIRCLEALNNQYNLNIGIIGIVRNIEKANSIFPNHKIKWYRKDLSLTIQLDIIEPIDYVFHCACPTSSKFYIENPVELIKTSVLGSICLLDYAVKNNIEGFVYLSSCEIYGSVFDDSVPLKEENTGFINPIDIRSGYPMAKLLIETLCHSYSKEYKLPVFIARLTQTLGAGVSLDDNRVFAQFARSAINEEDMVLHTSGDSAKPYCYTIDAVNALFYLLFRGSPGEAYNIANSNTYISIRDLAYFIVRNFAKTAKVQIQNKSNMGYAPLTKLRMSTDKIESLGWKPYYTLEKMFQHLIKYYSNPV